MTTYKEIFGKPVKVLSSDPTDAGAEGQVWYNTTDGVFKTVLSVGAWSAGGTMNTAGSVRSGAGTSTAGLAFLGRIPGITTNTETYNGSTWSEVNNLSTARFGAGGTGSQTAALAFSGRTTTSAPNSYSTSTEEFDGTNWTGGGAYPVATTGLAGAGTQTAGLGFAGGIPTYLTTTNEYNGTSWTAGGALNTGRSYLAGFGIQTAAVAAGGAPRAPAGNLTEEYNGSSWTTSGTMNVARNSLAGNGTQTSGLIYGGDDGSLSNKAEQYNGTSWAATSNLTTARRYIAGFGSAGNTTGVAFAGETPSNTAATEEFNTSIYSPIAATWASGGTVPYTSRQNMSFGTQDAAINVGGYVTATLSTAASYDGASWTASPSLNVAARMGGVAGTQTAGLQFGGIQPPGTYNTNMQTWNGSAWADSPLNLTTGTYGLMGCGTQTAALKVGGENPAGGNYTTSEEFDGSGWTAGGALPEAKYVGAGNGVQTSALITGGSPSGTTTFEYNGSSWTAGGALSTSRPGTQAGSAGVSSSSNIVFGGNAPGGVISATEGYDGTSWSTRPSLATGRGSTTGNGTSTAGLMVSGGPPSSTTTLTEEFTGEIPALGYKTLTSS
jgi:hypothetical protein